MSDRLEEIKEQWKDEGYDFDHMQEMGEDLTWLISEVERMRAINEVVCEELSGYQSLFDTLNLIDPRAVEKAIDVQEDGEKQ
ncbi:hypothetical protein [Sporolactobacillus terrae]|uniref:hypothetical protein n=1 Tax=Sporolactobacillus terrae TaxID=269673 RepID=UPI00049077D2|nr:hypothetical protein [Sporolactobacillus terrae]